MATTVVVLAAVALLGGFLFLRSRQGRASDAFAQALMTFRAPLAEALPPNSNAPHFKTASEKYQQAYKQFDEVAGRYSRFSQGKLARYYAALCERELGKFPEAEKDLRSIAAGSNPDLASLAKMSLAAVYQQTGRNDEAEKVYRELEEHPTATVPKAAVELAMAELYQKTKPAQAAAMYKKIQSEFPGGAAGDQASKILQSLPQ